MILHRRATPPRLELEKGTLSIQDDSGQCSASISPDPLGELNIDVNSSGSGFKKFDIVMQRSLGESSLEEQIYQFNAGPQSFKWKPIVRNLDHILVATSYLDCKPFCDFLKESFGIDYSYLLHYATNLKENFILSDSEDVSYTISLKGERGMFRTAISDSIALTLRDNNGD